MRMWSIKLKGLKIPERKNRQMPHPKICLYTRAGEQAEQLQIPDWLGALISWPARQTSSVWDKYPAENGRSPLLQLQEDEWVFWCMIDDGWQDGIHRFRTFRNGGRVGRPRVLQENGSQFSMQRGVLWTWAWRIVRYWNGIDRPWISFLPWLLFFLVLYLRILELRHNMLR